MEHHAENEKTAATPSKRFSKRVLILTVLITAAATLGVICGAAWLLVGPQGFSLLEEMALINIRFVGDYDKTAVMDAAGKGMISALNDRWSYYLDQESYARLKDDRDNSYVGVGLTVSYEDERGLLVLAVSGDGPADKAGILPGDIITVVDGASIAGDNRSHGAELIRGEEGTSVKLDLLDKDGGTRTVEATRGRVEEDPVSYQMLDGNIGLITLKNFFSRSADGVKAAVEDLSSQGAVALVFDLRNNPGGYVNELTDTLDYLLPEGPIFRSRDRAGREETIVSDADCVKLPMAAIVNGNSYSAAEFFAAELQEKGGAVVAGTETCGKGYSQQTFPLLSGGAVGISTRTYLTGNGVSLIGTGLTPDPRVALTEEQDTLLLQGRLKPADDPQLQAAIQALF